MWFIGVEVEIETSAPPPKKNSGSAPATACYFYGFTLKNIVLVSTVGRKNNASLIL